jgi:hypothetical protein
MYPMMNTQERLRQLAIGICILTWVLVAFVLGVHAHLHPTVHTVYDIYAPAARNWWAGRDMYVRTTEYYRYSPLFAIAVSPFAALPDAWGCPLWKIANMALYAAALAAFLRRVVPVQLGTYARVAFFFLVFSASIHSLYIGQANVLMLSCLLFGLAALAGGRWNRAAGWIAFACLIKGYPVALGLLLGAGYSRRFAGRFVAATALGLLLPFAMQAPDVVSMQYASWFHHLRDSTQIMRERLRSIDNLLAVTGYPITAQAFALCSMATGAIALVLALAARHHSRDPKELLTYIYLLFSAWALLFGPATESCTYILIAPGLAWMIVRAFGDHSSFARKAALVSSLLLAGPLVTDMFGNAVRGYCNTHGAQPIAALLFLGCVLMPRSAHVAEALASAEPADLLPAG